MNIEHFNPELACRLAGLDIRIKHFVLIFFCFFLFYSCKNPPDSKETRAKKDSTLKLIAEAETILSRKQVPILCYHQIRNWRADDSKRAKDYIVSIENFREHLKMLYDNGYTTILPDQLHSYLTAGTPIPPKAVMLTFDDTKLDQYTVALPEMNKYGFKGVFFIMTVALNRPGYMSNEQVKLLSDSGHIVGSHTWDHQNVKKLKEEKQWAIQLDRPTKQLESITGKKIKYFAYPFGLWNEEAIRKIKSRGFLAAFQLSDKRNRREPLFTIRRTLASGYWNSKKLNKAIRRNF